MSGSAFARCATTPSSAPATVAHTGATVGTGSASVATDGSRPNATTNGRNDHTVRLSHRSYDQPLATATRWASAARAPRASESGTQHAAATAAAAPTARWVSV